MTRNESHLASAFAAELAQVLEASTGERPSVEAGAPVMAPAAEVLASRQEFTGGSLKDVWIAADPSGARQIGEKLLRAAGIDEHDDQEATSTYLETLRQTLSSFSRTIGAREGGE